MAVRLLIVEPDRTLLETYRAYFDRAGLVTATAFDSRTAIAHVVQRSISMVVMEPELPDDPSQLLQAIADRTAQRPLPVIVVSRCSRISLRFPVHDYHIKPVRMSTLLEQIFQLANVSLAARES